MSSEEVVRSGGLRDRVVALIDDKLQDVESSLELHENDLDLDIHRKVD